VNLILTTCANYQRTELEVFVISLRKHVKNAQLVVFTNNVGTETQWWLREQGAILVPMQIGGWKRGVFNRFAKLTSRNPLRYIPRVFANELAFHTASLMSLRFLYYRKWLEHAYHDYRKVLITDCRDVVFQKDPFPYITSREVIFFLESKPIDYGPKSNRYWLDQVYTRSESDFLTGMLVACAGTTLGTSREIVKYLDAMQAEILRARKIMHYGEDQAMHNMILRRKEAEFARRTESNAEGAVLTIMGCPTTDYISGPDNLVRNRKGQVIPLLHMYDRVPELIKAQRERLCLDGQ
jgi:hypothetical protein